MKINAGTLQGYPRADSQAALGSDTSKVDDTVKPD